MYEPRYHGIRRWGRYAVIALAIATSGCIATTRNPERLFPIAAEMEQLRLGQDDLIKQYWTIFATNSEGARTLRNEIITQRMYAIDVQYTQYETALTREIQEVGFGSLTTAGGLTTAATLVASAGAKTILSALATAVLNTKGHYESQVLLAQTMRAIQKQMRLSRNNVAIVIAGKMTLNVADYPLWAALSDLEDYYQAGTLTSGVIDISTTVGTQEAESKVTKAAVSLADPAVRRSMIIESAAAPILEPPRFSVMNPAGLTEFERRGLTPARIREMECVVLPPAERTGRFTAALRAAVLARVGKDPNSGTGITNRDAQKITNEFNANPCP